MDYRQEAILCKQDVANISQPYVLLYRAIKLYKLFCEFFFIYQYHILQRKPGGNIYIDISFILLIND